MYCNRSCFVSANIFIACVDAARLLGRSTTLVDADMQSLRSLSFWVVLCFRGPWQPCSLAASSFAACTHSTSRCGRGRRHYWPKAFKFTPVSRHRESVLAYASSSSGSGMAIGDRPAGPDFGRIATWRAPTSAFRPEGRLRCFLITDRPKSGPVSGSNSPVSVWVAVWSSTQIF
jgi:hypothetical protein